MVHECSELPKYLSYLFSYFCLTESRLHILHNLYLSRKAHVEGLLKLFSPANESLNEELLLQASLCPSVHISSRPSSKKTLFKLSTLFFFTFFFPWSLCPSFSALKDQTLQKGLVLLGLALQYLRGLTVIQVT